MSDFPSVTGADVVAAFERAGFVVARIKGSHHIMKREDHEFLLSVPVHVGQDLKRGTLRSLVRDAGLTKEEFIELLK